MSDNEELVVKKGGSESWIDTKKYGAAIIIILLIIIVSSVAYYKNVDNYSGTPDSAVARKSQNQERSDTEVDKVWNKKQLEISVTKLNKKLGAFD
jgi:hypothetical protein